MWCWLLLGAAGRVLEDSVPVLHSLRAPPTSSGFNTDKNTEEECILGDTGVLLSIFLLASSVLACSINSEAFLLYIQI